MKTTLLFLFAVLTGTASANRLEEVKAAHCETISGINVEMSREPGHHRLDATPIDHHLLPHEQIEIGEETVCKDCVYFQARVADTTGGRPATLYLAFESKVDVEAPTVTGNLGVATDWLLTIPMTCSFERF